MLNMCTICDPIEEAETTFPEDTWPEFTVRIEKDPDVSIGLTVDSADGELLHVCTILDGPVDDYNNMIALGSDVNIHPIQAGDYIWAVNGIDRQVRDMLEELRCETALHLSVVRPRLWSVTLERDGPGDPFGPAVINPDDDGADLRQSLGIDVNWHPIGSSLLIRNVGDGLINEWNAQNPGYEVQANDRIVEVNGVVAAGNVAPLIDQLLLDQPMLELVLSRPGDKFSVPPPDYQEDTISSFGNRIPAVGNSRNADFELAPDPDEGVGGAYPRIPQSAGDPGERNLPNIKSTQWLGAID